ncbi:uroporphyrinogen-III synthase [Coemansia spiralis]|nr:uroporphyrinogen-III synthase [Coemansia spiralis]
MNSDARSAVVLFRDPVRGQSYHAALAGSHSAVASIPVLEHQCLLTARDVERMVGQHEGGQAYAAIVFTSHRAVQALGRAAAEWLGAGDSAASAGDRSARWRALIGVPIFAVGRATGDACRSLLPDLQACGPDIRGEACGNAAALLPEITRFCSVHGSVRPRLAFFCGDQRRDTLPRGIAQSGCAELCEIAAYTTVGRCQSNVQSELAAVVDRHSVRRLWLVVFSPSGARVVVPSVQRLVQLGALSMDAAAAAGIVCRFAAIGETTAAEIAALGIDARSVVQAAEPTEHGVSQALCVADAEAGISNTW